MKPAVYRIDVYLNDEDDELWWGGEGGMDEGSVGVDFHSTDDPADLVLQVEEEVGRHRRRHPNLELRWVPTNRTAAELRALAAQAGVNLPGSIVDRG